MNLCLRVFIAAFVFLINSISYGSQESLPEGEPGKLISAAIERTKHNVVYNGAYIKIPYPMGDVPDNIGVCTDLVIRSYRFIGIDLQHSVHEDMKRHFSAYPKKWGLKRPDTNIDHRRVSNLKTFFKRKGAELPVSQNPADYKPADLVTWDLPGSLPHIGIVTHRKSPDGKRPLIVHNIGQGPVVEDMLFNFPITGHFRYFEKNSREEVLLPEKLRPAKWAKPITKPGVPNLHQITHNLYRSAQPTKDGMQELKKMGIRTIINLRAFHSDRDEIGLSGLAYEHIYMNTWDPEEEQIIRFLQIVTDPLRAPVLVHCLHGADRTGTMSAVYRIAVCGWSKEEAVKEMTHGGFGFHKIWKNLVKFIENLDMEQIKIKSEIINKELRCN